MFFSPDLFLYGRDERCPQFRPAQGWKGWKQASNVDVAVLHEGMLIEDERMNEVRE